MSAAKPDTEDFMTNTNKLLVAAAMMGIIGAGLTTATTASAAEKGHCMAANSCKGKSACKTDASSCKGQNGCKGQGYTETTKAKCDKLAKKNKAVHFDTAKM